MRKKVAILLLFILMQNASISQEGFGKKQVIFNVSIGAPHLTKTTVRLITKTDAFKNSFNNIAGVTVKGLNPVSFKCEYGFNKYFGLGITLAAWNLKIDLTDRYNVLNSSQTLGADSVDIYKFKITSASIGIRPSLHIPTGDLYNDVYFSLGLGYTKLSLTVDFNSTDINRTLPVFDYRKKFSLPGSFYVSPLLGYRHYFSKPLAGVIEFGWEKGAIIQAGLSLRCGKINSEKK